MPTSSRMLGSPLLVTASAVLALVTVSVSAVGWDYDPKSNIGPKKWKDVKDGDPIFEQFGGNANNCDGKMQSPIDFEFDNNDKKKDEGVCPDDEPIITKRGRRNWEEVTFEILPHTLRTHFPQPGEGLQNPASAKFDSLFERKSPIFMDVKTPSEHTVNGVNFPGELQIAHGYGNKVVMLSIFIDYPNEDGTVNRFMDGDDADADFNEGGGSRGSKKSKDHRDLQIDQIRHNDKFELFIREWEEIALERSYSCAQNTTDTTINIPTYQRTHPILSREEMLAVFGDEGENRADFDLYSLLPTPYYFGYKGSITVPPCIERAIWRVIDLPMMISMEQYQRLQTVLLSQQSADTCDMDSSISFMNAVNRPVQKGKDIEEVFHCTMRDFKPTDDNGDGDNTMSKYCGVWPYDYHGTYRLLKGGYCDGV